MTSLKKNFRLGLCFTCIASFCSAMASTTVDIQTNKGNIIVKLNSKKAPVTVKNFLHYVKKGFYTNTIFHRVIPGFMIQGGGLTKHMTKKKTDKPIKLESSNGLKNTIGTIAMARTNDPNSATSQFFINLKDNPFLDYKKDTTTGYAVFGKVIGGMKTVKAIAKTPTGFSEGRQDVPIKSIIINKITILPAKKTSQTYKMGRP